MGGSGSPHGARAPGRQRTGMPNRRRWLPGRCRVARRARGGAAASAPRRSIRSLRPDCVGTRAARQYAAQTPLLGGARQENSGDAPRGPCIWRQRRPPRGRCMRWLPRMRGGILHPRSWGYREPSCGCQVACGLGKTMGRLRPAVSYGRCRGQTPAGSSCAAVFPRALCRLRRGTQLGLERWPSPQATVRMSSGLIPRCMRHLLSLLARSRAAG